MTDAPAHVGLKGGDNTVTTTGLTGGSAQPTFVSLGGSGGAIDSQSSGGSCDEEIYIKFDFIVQLSANILEEKDNIKTAIKDCVDCNMEQIQDFSMREIQRGRTKVKGKIYTDNWELPMLDKKFKSIISDHLLSSQIQRVCELEDRPLISRFFAKSSREIQAKELRKSSDAIPGKANLDDHRIEAGAAKIASKPLAKLEVSDGPEPNMDRQKTPMNKRAKEPGSASLDSESGQNTVGRRTRNEQSNQGCCVVL